MNKQNVPAQKKLYNKIRYMRTKFTAATLSVVPSIKKM